MASTASSYVRPQPQISNSTWRNPPKPTHHHHNQKPLKNLHFFFLSSPPSPLSLSSSSPFPPSLKPPPPSSSDTTPVLDSPQDNNLVELENVDHHPTTMSFNPRIFFQDPPWIASLFLKGIFTGAEREKSATAMVRLESREIERRRYNLLRRLRQIRVETEAWERMAEEYREMEREMRERRLASNLPHVKALLLGWFEPLRDAIANEQKVKGNKQKTEMEYFSFNWCAK